MKHFWLIGIVLALTGCRHKELWMGGEHFATIEVNFDWSEAHTLPEEQEGLSMSMYLYPEDGSAPLYYELSGHDGGRVRVPFGRYTVIAWNHENDAILIRGQEKAATLEFYTRPQPLLASLGLTSTRAPRPTEASEERSVLEPGPLWTGCVQDLEVSMQAPLKWDVPVEDAYIQFSVGVMNMGNIVFVSESAFALSSVCASYFPFDRSLGEENVSIPFDGQIIEDEEYGEDIMGHCTLFGHCPKDEQDHWLTIYAIMADGSKYYTNVDVSDAVHPEEPATIDPGDPGAPGNPPQPGNPNPGIIDLNLDDISFPNPFEGDPSAFTRVDEWLTEKIDIIMN